MKNILYTLALIVCFSSFGQEQLLNGISLNAPNGFVKTGNLQWKNGNENVLIQSIEGSYADFKDLQSGAKLACKKASRASTFVDFGNLEVSGETYGFCLQKGQNTLALTQTYVYRDGYVYVVQVSADPDNYKRCFEILGYMIMRITTEDYSNAIEPNPDADTYYNRGVSKGELKDYNGAISDYNKAIELDPNYTKAYFNRGNSKHKLKDYYGAISDYSRAIELDPNIADAYYGRGVSKLKLKDYNGAISDYNKAIELDPNYTKAYINRGISKDKLKDYYGAISDYSKAIELNPNNAEAYYNRVFSKYYTNDLNGACEDAKKSRSLGADASKLIEAVCN